LDPGLRGGKPATNRFSYTGGTVLWDEQNGYRNQNHKEVSFQSAVLKWFALFLCTEFQTFLTARVILKLTALVNMNKICTGIKQEQGFGSRQRQEIFLCATASRAALGSNQSHTK
jgi:hypothetical protein